MQTLEFQAGSHIFDCFRSALRLEIEQHDSIQFGFNGTTFTVEPHMTEADIRAHYKEQTGRDLTTPSEDAENARKASEEQARKWAEAIAAAGAMTEQQMRDATVPTPKSAAELSRYIDSLISRPHDYGTCVYALSMAAVAAFNYVARELEVTGFQASCADMDILRRTRGLNAGFMLLDYEKLLYPQYQSAEHFPTAKSLLLNPRVREWATAESKKKLAENESVHPDVKAHWEWMASLPPITEEKSRR